MPVMKPHSLAYFLKITRTLLILGVMVVLASLAGFAQGDPGQVEDLLDRFDGRVGEVQDLVENSRDPEAARLLHSAIQLRDQAEAELRGGNPSRALDLATRALSTLDKAQRQAQSGGGTMSVKKLERLLASSRQQTEEARRRLNESEAGDVTDKTVKNNQNFLQRQSDATQALIEKAESKAESSPATLDDDLVKRARMLFEQAIRLIPNDGNSNPPPDKRYIENRIREARRIVDKSENDLDQVEKELGSLGTGGVPTNRAGSYEIRIRNIGREINRANDLLDLIDSSGKDSHRSGTSTVLGLLRRASELARQALKSSANSTELAEEWERRNQIVGSLIDQVDDLIQAGAQPPLDYEQSLDFRNQSITAASAQHYEQALKLLAEAATRLNRALALLGANRSPAMRLEILENLYSQFEKRYQEILSQAPTTSAECLQKLQLANQQAEQSRGYQQSNNLDNAFHAINQAQRLAEEAAACLGLNVSRIRSLLDRLQNEYDRRQAELESHSPPEPDPALEALLSEAEGLRQQSDSLESQGQFEAAVQTIGRAISTLGNAQRLLSAPSQGDAALLERLQQRFDERYSKVEDLVQKTDNPLAESLLNEARSFRDASDTSQAEGRIRKALNEIGLAVQRLEAATRNALGLLSSSL